MEAVFGLLENRVGVRFERLIGDFLAAVGRQAMHHERAGLRDLHEFVIDAVTSKLRDAISGFILLAHAHPHVGVEHVGARGGVLKAGRHRDFSAGTREQIGGRLETLRRGDTALLETLNRVEQRRAFQEQQQIYREVDRIQPTESMDLRVPEAKSSCMKRVFGNKFVSVPCK